MSHRILYQTDNGGVAVIVPSAECLKDHTLDEIAQKDVPAGKPYKIVHTADVPSDRTFRAAWEVDANALTDGIGAETQMFVTDPQHPKYVKQEVAQ